MNSRTRLMDLNYARGNVPNQRTGQNQSDVRNLADSWDLTSGWMKWSRFFGYAIVWLACTIRAVAGGRSGELRPRYRELVSHNIGWVGEYARFDSELGWATIPNEYLGIYSRPGVYSFNSEAFAMLRFSRKFRGKFGLSAR